MTTIETTRSARHEFYITKPWMAPDAFEVRFRPLNPKTGKPWQAFRHLVDGADVTPAPTQYSRWDRPVAYSTIELARAAVARKQETLR